MTRSPITTHVLDTALGRPAKGVALVLERQQHSDWIPIGAGETDEDGRCLTLLAPGTLQQGVYRLSFGLDRYFETTGRRSFYPEATIIFRVDAHEEHYHVPLLLAPFGYTTYRGS